MPWSMLIGMALAAGFAGYTISAAVRAGDVREEDWGVAHARHTEGAVGHGRGLTR